MPTDLITLPLVKRHIAVPLTETRRQELKDELAEAFDRKDRAEKLKAEIVDTHNRAIKHNEKVMRRCNDSLQLGREMQELECEQIVDYHKNAVLLYHPITKQVLEERTLTAEERERVDGRKR
jgi:hypothetical protein